MCSDVDRAGALLGAELGRPVGNQQHGYPILGKGDYHTQCGADDNDDHDDNNNDNDDDNNNNNYDHHHHNNYDYDNYVDNIDNINDVDDCADVQFGCE